MSNQVYRNGVYDNKYSPQPVANVFTKSSNTSTGAANTLVYLKWEICNGTAWTSADPIIPGNAHQARHYRQFDIASIPDFEPTAWADIQDYALVLRVRNSGTYNIVGSLVVNGTTPGVFVAGLQKLTSAGVPEGPRFACGSCTIPTGSVIEASVLRFGGIVYLKAGEIISTYVSGTASVVNAFLTTSINTPLEPTTLSIQKL